MGDPDGFVFNMSVGYSLEGIKSEKVDKYIEGMKDASGTEVWAECRDWALANLDRFDNVDADFVNAVSPQVSNSVTESTLHGCPPDEIERIATYLITEKGVNTYIKCNPTLLGYDFARERLNELGFDYIVFDDTHFREDLQWADAVPMFERLIELCAEKGLAFGVKLTNTFPVDVTRGELPSEEMYMSGRSLFPLTIELARRIARQFDGKLRISYSGGADARNIRELYAAGIWPITMATNVLKPGGYERFFADRRSSRRRAAPGLRGRRRRDRARLPHRLRQGLPEAHQAGQAAQDRRRAPAHELLHGAVPHRLPHPAGHPGLPLPRGRGQVRRGAPDRRGAQRPAAHHRQPLPAPLRRQVRAQPSTSPRARASASHKLAAARGGFDEVVKKLRAAGPARLASAADKNVAVIGGGPAGLATAFFLTRAGAKVTIIERTDKLGGVARHVIPEFRISHDDIDKDVALCLAFGAQVQMEREVTSVTAALRRGLHGRRGGHGRVGAGQGGPQGRRGDRRPGVPRGRQGRRAHGAGHRRRDRGRRQHRHGRRARGQARRGRASNVRIVYRRTKREMPADEEELQLALEEGIELCELLAPIGVADGMLACEVMRLGEPDESGRRRPEGTGETVQVPATAVICAVGEQIERGLYEGAGVEVDRRGRPAGTATGVDHVWAAGDCRRGPATFVEAIADAQAVARDLAGVDFNKYAEKNVRADKYDAIMGRKGDVCLDVAGCTSEPLPGLRHRLRGLLRRLPQPRQRGDQGAGPRAGAGRPRGRHVQRVRQLRRLLPVERAPIQGQAHALLERRGHGREREPRLPAAVRRRASACAWPSRRRRLRRGRRRLRPARGRAPHHPPPSATSYAYLLAK